MHKGTFQDIYLLTRHDITSFQKFCPHKILRITSHQQWLYKDGREHIHFITLICAMIHCLRLTLLVINLIITIRVQLMQDSTEAPANSLSSLNTILSCLLFCSFCDYLCNSNCTKTLHNSFGKIKSFLKEYD